MVIFSYIWKKGKLLAIPKKGKNDTNPLNYKPICILSLLGKNFEKLIKEELEIHLHKRKLISDKQFGFTKGRGTNEALHRVIEEIEFNYKNKLSQILISYNLKKAYDIVCVNKLIDKLITIEFEDKLISIIKQFLTNREYRTMIDGAWT